MDNRIIMIAIIYSILNAFFVILPQFEHNQDIKSQSNSNNILTVVSQNPIAKISDIEIIYMIDKLISESGLEKLNYEYIRDDQRNLQAHVITVSLEGESHNIAQFVNSISKIKGIQMDTFLISKQNNKINANCSILFMGGKNE